MRDFLDEVSSPKRRRDAETMVELMGRATGEEPKIWSGSIVGFGEYHYRYKSGREGDSAAAAFAVRRAATVVYLADGVGAHTDLLEQLGPHEAGIGCIYIKDLAAVDPKILETVVARSYTTLTSGTYSKRARDGSQC